MFIYLYSAYNIYIYIHVYVDAAGDVQLEKPQAEERTREEGGKEEGRGNVERG